MRVIVLSTLLLWVIMFAGIMTAFADSRHTIINYETIEQTIVKQADSSGAALAIAKSQHNFDWSTEKWQGSVGVGSFDGNDAISFGIGKRLGKTLVNGSIGREGGKYGYGVGVNLRF